MTNETRITLIDYERYKENYSFRNRTGLAPQTRALAFCMDAAGIKKLNTREDMHELIIRMTLVFKHMKIFEAFLIKKYLFHLKFLGRNIFFNTDDLQNHIGMEILDPKTEQLTRDEWIQKAGRLRWSKTVKEAMLHFINLSRITWILTDDEERQGYTWYYPRQDKQAMELNNAKILADTITSKIDEIHFDKYRERNNNPTAINETGNESVKIEFPLIRDRQQTSETKNKIEERPSSNIRNEELPKYIIEEMTPDKRKKAGYIPWPFAKGMAREREYYGIDPRWN